MKEFDVLGFAWYVIDTYTPLWLVMLLSFIVGFIIFGIIVSQEVREELVMMFKYIFWCSVIGVGSLFLTLIVFRLGSKFL